MLTFIFCIFAVAFAGVLGGTCWLLAAGLRNGDRPGDAGVTARLDDDRPLVIATVRNPSDTPVLAALRAGPAVTPAWLAGAHGTSVPRLTVPGRIGGRRLRPERFAIVGVVAAADTAEFVVPAPVRRRHCLLTVAVGQQASRLRLHRLRLGPVRYTSAGRDDLIMVG